MIEDEWFVVVCIHVGVLCMICIGCARDWIGSSSLPFRRRVGWFVAPSQAELRARDGLHPGMARRRVVGIACSAYS